MDLEKKPEQNGLDIEIDSVSGTGIDEFVVKRDLSERQISFLAIGGAVGTGLFISTGNTIAYSGPVNALISYLFMTTLCYSVTQSVGEMATYLPTTGSFTQFVAKWCSPALGAALGWNYWFAWTITFALEISVAGQVIQYWTDKVPLAAWISIFFVVLFLFNLFPVKFYGELEFYLTLVKLISIVGWLIYALCMVCGAGQTGPIGFRYWRNPGPWGPGLYVQNQNTARFLGWLNSLISAAFTFSGTETVAIAAGETSNPRKSIPKAVNKVLFRIIVFFVLSIFLIGLTVPFDDPRLGPNQPEGSDSAYTSSSPFIIAMLISGTKVLPDIMNACILVTIMSAGNSNIYYSSRILYGLAQAKIAPKIFLKSTKTGVPWVGVCVSSVFGALGYLAVSNGTVTVFSWFLNITATAGLIAWALISFTHIRFMRVLKLKGISRDLLPYKSKFMPYSAYYAFVAIVIVSFIQGFGVFFEFNASDFFVNYISLILFVISWIGFHFFYNGFNKSALTWRSLLIPINELDIESGVREVDDLVWDDSPPKNLWEKFWSMVI